MKGRPPILIITSQQRILTKAVVPAMGVYSSDRPDGEISINRPIIAAVSSWGGQIRATITSSLDGNGDAFVVPIEFRETCDRDSLVICVLVVFQDFDQIPAEWRQYSDVKSG
jgi:hypothetical protein